MLHIHLSNCRNRTEIEDQIGYHAGVLPTPFLSSQAIGEAWMGLCAPSRGALNSSPIPRAWSLDPASSRARVGTRHIPRSSVTTSSSWPATPPWGGCVILDVASSRQVEYWSGKKHTENSWSFYEATKKWKIEIIIWSGHGHKKSWEREREFLRTTCVLSTRP